MTRSRLGFVAAAGILLAVGLGLPAAAEEDDEPAFTTKPQDGEFVVAATSNHTVRLEDGAFAVSSATQQSTAETYEESQVVCALRAGSDAGGVAIDSEVEVVDCDPEEGPSAAEVVALVSQEFRRLPLIAPAITHQPGGDWALVNIDFIVYADAGAQELATTILGTPVTIRATPVSYSWDFGDGSPALPTSNPGAPYPNQTVAHIYTSATDAVTVTLTTSWQGEFRIGSGAWLPIAGFATTTSTTGPIEIVAMDVHLVPNE